VASADAYLAEMEAEASREAAVAAAIKKVSVAAAAEGHVMEAAVEATQQTASAAAKKAQSQSTELETRLSKAEAFKRQRIFFYI